MLFCGCKTSCAPCRTHARVVNGNSWLYHFESYRRLFPPGYGGSRSVLRHSASDPGQLALGPAGGKGLVGRLPIVPRVAEAFYGFSELLDEGTSVVIFIGLLFVGPMLAGGSEKMSHARSALATGMV